MKTIALTRVLALKLTALVRMRPQRIASLFSVLGVVFLIPPADVSAQAGTPRAGTEQERAWLVRNNITVGETTARDVTAAAPWGISPETRAGVEPQSDGGSPTPNWESIGPYGGEIADVAVSPADPNLLLAGLAPADSPGTLFRSVDGGAHWNAVAAFSNNSVYDVQFTSLGTAYVGSDQSAWKSTNGGTSWTQLQLGIGLNDVVLDVSIDPNNENILWVGVADAFGTQSQTVLRSTNGGATWVNRTPPISPLSCLGIAIKSTDSNRVYACFGGAFGGGAFWVSTDAGQNWIDRSAGLPNRPMNDVIHDGNRVLVCGGQAFGSQFFGLYASGNDGQNWTALHNGWPSLVISDITMDPNNAAVLLAASKGRGVFRSTDSGASWTYGIGGTGSFSVSAVRFAPGSSTRILLGVSSLGIWQSVDAGSSFAAMNTGIQGLNTFDIASNPLNPLEFAVAFKGQNDGGIYTSTDGGQNWSVEPVPGTRYNFVAFSPFGLLYAISAGPSSIAPEGVYRRNLNGTWDSLGPNQGNLFESELHVILFSRNNSNLILAGGNDFGVAGFEGTVWISTDAGGTWTKSYEGPSGDSLLDLAWVEDGADLTALAAFSNFSGPPGGSLRTTDGGWTWINSSNGLAADARGVALASPAGEPLTFFYADQMYALGSGGLYKTTDAGLSWDPTGLIGTGTVSGVFCDPADHNSVYVLRPQPERVLFSGNGGDTFAPFNTGLNGAGIPNSLAYAATPEPRLLFASTNGSYATLLSTPADVWGAHEEVVGAPTVGPNPAYVREGVAFRIREGLITGLRIYDAGGALVRTLSSADRSDTASGTTLFWDARANDGRKVASGVYLARLATEGAPRTYRITLLR